VLGLGPKHITAYQDHRGAREAVCATWTAVEQHLEDHRRHDCKVNALMLVGNQPAVDWFLAGKRHCSPAGKPEWLLPRAIDFGPISVAPGEIVCLARRAGCSAWPWHLWWVITPSDERVIEALRQKVQSKMMVLSVLAGFMAAMLTTVAVNLAGPDVGANRPGDRALLLAAVGFFSLATVVLVIALLAYDRLMMPQRFWGIVRSRGGTNPLRSGPVARPPSSAGWVLYQHSVKIWQRVILALVLAGMGTVLVIGSTARVCGEKDGYGKSIWPDTSLPCPTESVDWEMYGVGVIFVLILFVGFLAWRNIWPELGTED
jgi:hypothetical protein